MKLRLILGALVLVTVFQFGLAANQALAQDLSITLAPGDTARVPLKFWCLDFGKPFPTEITGPIEGSPAAAQKALQAAITKGATETDPYQTQLAIWRATDGTFHDVAGAGHVLAEQIYNDSVKLAVSPAPADGLAAAVAKGTVRVTFENFAPIADAARPELAPYYGTADMVIKNISNQSVTFTVSEYALFKPANGVNAQTLISHQDTTKQATVPTPAATITAAVTTTAVATETPAATATPQAGTSRLPTTGAGDPQGPQFQLLFVVGLGLLVMGLGLVLVVPMLKRPRAH